MSADPFTGQVAIIAGGASGIGRALGCLLAQRGASVIVADIDGAQTEETVACLRRQGGIAQGRRVDVPQFDQVRKLASGVSPNTAESTS